MPCCRAGTPAFEIGFLTCKVRDEVLAYRGLIDAHAAHVTVNGLTDLLRDRSQWRETSGGYLGRVEKCVATSKPPLSRVAIEREGEKLETSLNIGPDTRST
jgi:hypothetical protein